MRLHKMLLISCAVCTFLMFSSCKNNNLFSDYEIIDTVPNYSITILSDNLETTLSYSENFTTTKVSENDIIPVYWDEWIQKNGYMYDFDLDGEDEAFIFTYALWGEIVIYKISDDKYIPWGESIKINSIRPEWFEIKNLTLYYDKSVDNYFYINEYDIWEKYYNYADVNKYSITENGLVESNVAHCEFLYGNGIEFSINTLLGHENSPIGTVNYDDMVYYHNGVNEYLNQFEKIKTITMEDLIANKIEDIT